MVTIGRNQPCPCGSGKKYKRCCLPKDEAAASAALPTTDPTALRKNDPSCDFEWDDDHLDEDSNAVVDLIHEGRLDEAEAAARELLARYPEVVDGLERLAMVYDARGDAKQAAEYYRKAVAFILEEPEGYDPEIPTSLMKRANELDPQPS
jgi:tetratricopeptide (TPR) repeat protein